MKAFLLPPNPSEVSSIADEDDDDEEEEESGDDSSVGSISFTASRLQASGPSISLSYKRDPGDIMRLLTEDRQDEEEGGVAATKEEHSSNGARRGVQASNEQSFWKLPMTWNEWFPPPLDMNKRVSYLAPSSSEEDHSEEELAEQRDAYDDVAWAEKRAKEAIAFHRNNRRNQQSQGETTTPRSGPSGSVSTMMPSLFSVNSVPNEPSSPASLLWRNQNDPYLDWTIVVEREPSGGVDTYRVHKLVVGAGSGASGRLAGDIAQNPTMTEAHLTLNDSLADRIPDVLDWMYLPRGDAHKFDKSQFVNLMILADELDIPSLRNHLTEQYQQKVTVDDLTSIYGTWVQSKEEAGRLVAQAADRITGLVTGKVVDVIRSGNDADMDKLVDELAPVADQDLIVRVMTSDALMMDEATTPPEGVEKLSACSMVKSRSSSARRGWRSPIRIRFSESSLRMGRFVARFIRTNEKSSTTEVDDGPSEGGGGVISEKSIEEIRDEAPVSNNVPGSVTGSEVAQRLLDQLVQAWSTKYQSFQDETSSFFVQQTKVWKYDAAQAHVRALCQQHRELLDHSLREALAPTTTSPTTAAVSHLLTQYFGGSGRQGTTIGAHPWNATATATSSLDATHSSGTALVRRSSALSAALAPFARRSRSDKKKGPEAYAL